MTFKTPAHRSRSRSEAMALTLAMLLGACAGSGQPDTTEQTQVQAAQVEATPAAGAGSEATQTEVSDSASGFLDEFVVHEISIEFQQSDYGAMIETYATTGEKDWIEAIVTIDGVTYQQVGIRLKGNSSLRQLSGGGRGGDEFDSSGQPETLPWLIQLDRFNEGQNHDGVVEFVVRSNNSATALNEAAALDLLEAAGLASQDSAYTAFSVNGSNEELRLVMEHPDDAWVEETLTSEGVLYKAESGGDYSYRGEDPDAYAEIFDVEAGADDADLTPLIAFLDFINNADDDTFNTELSEYLDIEAFATYLALEDLMNNFDDIDGPGNNSYLFYDSATGVFIVVPWDHNLAFGTGRGGGFGSPRNEDGGEQPGEGGGFGPGGGGQGGGGQFGGGPGGRSNVLVERFLTNPEWQALYDQATDSLQENLFDSGVATDILEKWTTVLETRATNLVTSEQISEEASAISGQF